MPNTHHRRRRQLLRAAAAGLIAGYLPGGSARAVADPIIKRRIPASGETVAAIGMGTWITFNVGSDPRARQQRTEVLRTFLDRGGQLVDSSPMYGSAEAVLGHALASIERTDPLFAASKVWTPDEDATREQVARSERLWGIDRFDLMQVHNLVAWEAHLETLLAMREAGELRYVGITTSHGRRHRELERIMRERPIDFVQASYSLANREAEQRLLPLAAERDIAFIANRPFQGGRLIDRVKRHPFPGWAREAGLANWADALLKFIIAHPAVTCAIPATSRVDHMRENMQALRGPLPDEALRERLARHVARL
ncbi:MULTISPECIES: aldo/keto reductase [unclassified Guyparkeria]|uniref:aldo/keto reductase n=1 Tax=unclassified Guyparkeria TaxID=2626246 RepID=UPI000733410E|nr:MULTISPECIES: aldo/keto reductase [unclassified Guyparkeria]KTG16764.1 aldo/keto reductase [Guyparkeria sp. XI15]OAE85798.1 aldo/keto reductase [Guyparkeria sp. WRN-7]